MESTDAPASAAARGSAPAASAAGGPPATWLWRAEVAAVVGRCRVARMAVASTTGPLVSAQLFSTGGGRIFMVTPRESAKARVIRRDPRVAVILRAGRRSAVIGARARILDPLSPTGAAAIAASGLALGAALTRYALRNVDTLCGYVADLVPPRPGAIPFDRVILALEIERALLWSGSAITDVAGDWDVGLTGGEQSVAVPPAASWALAGTVPQRVASLLRDRQPAVVGWIGAAGPLLLPAAWDPVGRRAVIPAAVAEQVGAPSTSQAAVALDRSPAGRPSNFAGLVLRGPARLEPGADGLRCRQAPRRATWWQGFSVRTDELRTARHAGNPARRRTARVRRAGRPPVA